MQEIPGWSQISSQSQGPQIWDSFAARPKGFSQKHENKIGTVASQDHALPRWLASLETGRYDLSGSCIHFASWDSTSGRTAVPSALTASSASGSRPSAFRIVGATCVVAVGVETVRAVKLG